MKTQHLPGRTCLILTLFLLWVPGGDGEAAPATAGTYRGEGTRRMAELLERLPQSVDPMQVRFLSAQRAQRLGNLLDQPTPAQKALELMPQYATELLNSGRSAEALQVFDTTRQLAEQHDPGFLRQNGRLLQFFRALCHLRTGEQENCLVMHNADSCLLPIRGAGLHKKPGGSRAAIQILSSLLQQNPADLDSRWLLNIACMTVGDYPDKIPAAALIPPEVFQSGYDIKRFTNVAPRVGLDIDELSGGSVVEDFDNDGFLDVMTSSIGYRDQLRLFRSNGDGTFVSREREAGLEGETGGLNLIQSDYNNDGYVDVLVLRGAWFGAGGHLPNSLLRNNGNGTFEDVTESVGLLSFHPTQTAVWFDYNNDGWLDLFIGNESSGAERHPCELYRGNRDGTFTEVASQSGLDLVAFVKGATAGDYDNDGRVDLYVSVLGARNYLFRNAGPAESSEATSSRWRFEDVSAKAGVREPAYSFATWFFDYDNDGWLDLFVTGYEVRHLSDVVRDYLRMPVNSELPRLYRNKGDGTFEDVARQAGVAHVTFPMGANFGDLDNDGFLDFYLGTGAPDLLYLIPNRMFRNDGGRQFQDVTTSGGFGHLQKGHGISFADIDNDGDQDVHEDMGGAFTGDTAHNVLFENPGHGNHWITLKLEGVKSGRDARGARVELVVANGTEERRIHRVVGSGASFGASPLRQEIGIGNAAVIRRLAIRWPATGRIQEVKGVEVDRAYRIREDEPQAQPWTLKPFRLTADSSGGKHASAE